MVILIAGDFCPQNRVASLLDAKDFQKVLCEVKPIIDKSDYSIVNFECSVAKGGERPITKYGPSLKCSEKGIEAIKWAGFDCVSLANNHFLDYGEEGVRNTLEACKKHKIDTVGGGMNLYESSQILYKEIGGKILAVINCCEHEFSIASETTAGSNPLNPVQNYYEIKEARQRADYVLIIVHGGHELWQLPSPRMVETYRFFVDAGADAVVNHHQHCFSGYEVYRGKPIFYGLGNFCFDKPDYYKGLWEYGYMVSVNFSKEISFELIPYEQCKKEPAIKIIEKRDSFEAEISRLNIIIGDEKKLQEATSNYYDDVSKIMRIALAPYSQRILMKLCNMGWIPTLYNKSRGARLFNMVFCESQRDKLIHFLKHSYD